VLLKYTSEALKKKKWENEENHGNNIHARLEAFEVDFEKVECFKGREFEEDRNGLMGEVRVICSGVVDFDFGLWFMRCGKKLSDFMF